MDLPPELKHIASFLKRADELDEQEPTIAYYCKFYAAQFAVRNAKTPAARQIIAQLLKELEEVCWYFFKCSFICRKNLK